MSARARARARARGLIAVALLVAGGAAAALVPAVAPIAPDEGVPVASRSSGAWYCPHGGGEGWQTTLTVANPGETSVGVRITTFSEDARPRRIELEVPAASTRRVEVTARARESGSMVEYFGGWVAAGWVSVAGGTERGVAAEPCAPDTADVWFLPDASTVEDEDDAVVLLNPFSVDAVVSLTLLSPGRDPTRTEGLTNVIVRAQTARTIRLGRTLLGESVVSTIVEVSVGRVAAGLLAVTGSVGIRAAIGYAGPPPAGTVLVGGADSGRSDLILSVPPDGSPSLAATLLGTGPEQPVAGLPDAELPSGSSRAFPVATGPASAIVVATAGVPVGRRHIGRSGDDAASIGVLPAPAWVVLPAIAGGPFHGGIVVANVGDVATTVTLRPLGATVAPLTLLVPAHGAMAVPEAFADAVAGVGVLVTSDGGAIVAATAASSLGKRGGEAYAVANGLPIPPRFLPA